MNTKDQYSELSANVTKSTLFAPPQPVGYWVLYPGSAWFTRFAMFVRPTDEQIANTQSLLGWGWEEA